MLTAWQCFRRQFKRELLLTSRKPRLLINAALFLAMIVVFFPLTIPPNPVLVESVIPGVIWMANLLTMLLAADRFFLQDIEEGMVEQWLTSGYSLTLIVAAKLVVNWWVSFIPLLCFCPFLALFFPLSWLKLGVLMLNLLVGTPAILALCALTAAFSANLEQKSVFMALILLPLTLPVMILGSNSLTMLNFPTIMGSAALLLASSLLCVCFLPFAIAAIIKISFAG